MVAQAKYYIYVLFSSNKQPEKLEIISDHIKGTEEIFRPETKLFISLHYPF